MIERVVFPEWLLGICNSAAVKHRERIDDAVAEAIAKAVRNPMFAAVRDALIQSAIRGLIHNARERQNQALRQSGAAKSRKSRGSRSAGRVLGGRSLNAPGIVRASLKSLG